jgi:hypothetical protein
MSKQMNRSSLGTFLPKFKEPTVAIHVRVPKSIADKIKRLENSSDFMRMSLARGLQELEEKNIITAKEAN